MSEAALVRFSAPRNPEMPSYDLAQVLHAGFFMDDESELVRCWEGETIKPAGRSRVGRLRVGNRGLVFLPDVGPTLQEAALLPVQATLGFALGHIEHELGFIGEEMGLPDVIDHAVGAADAMANRLTLRGRVQKLLRDRDCFALPYYDIVDTWLGEGHAWLQSSYVLFVTVEDAAGRRTYAFRGDANKGGELPAIAIMPALLMHFRVQSESHELETSVQQANIEAEPIRAALVAQFEAKYGPSWTDYVEDANDEFRKLIAREFWAKGYTAQQLAQTVLRRFEPMLDAYRQIPVIAWDIECLEAVALGEPLDWKPDRAMPLRWGLPDR